MDSTELQDLSELLSNEIIDIEMPTFDDLSTSQLKQVIKNYRLHLLHDITGYTKQHRQELLQICEKMFHIDKDGIRLKVNEPIKFEIPKGRKKALVQQTKVKDNIHRDFELNEELQQNAHLYSLVHSLDANIEWRTEEEQRKYVKEFNKKHGLHIDFDNLHKSIKQYEVASKKEEKRIEQEIRNLPI
ncbi:MAG: hypothetical protein P4L35_07840 [Ignavibacteriaceae bacterium]|nr:hypothetical protein [Ignavibacteriaceae bacterium]